MAACHENVKSRVQTAESTSIQQVTHDMCSKPQLVLNCYIGAWINSTWLKLVTAGTGMTNAIRLLGTLASKSADFKRFNAGVFLDQMLFICHQNLRLSMSSPCGRFIGMHYINEHVLQIESNTVLQKKNYEIIFKIVSRYTYCICFKKSWRIFRQKVSQVNEHIQMIWSNASRVTVTYRYKFVHINLVIFIYLFERHAIDLKNQKHTTDWITELQP